MKQIDISVPDHVIEIIDTLAETYGMSRSATAAMLLVPAANEAASQAFKGINFLKHAKGKNGNGTPTP